MRLYNEFTMPKKSMTIDDLGKKIDRLDQNNFEERYYPGFSFVPLINS